MKKLAALVLAGALSLSLAAPALAADTPVLISAKRPVITVNGVTLNTSKLPQADGIPLRAFVEADGGSAEWYAKENQSLFYTEDGTISVDFAAGTATVDRDMVFEGVKAVEGVTFAPAAVVDALPGVTVTEKNGDYTITTSSADPVVKLAKDIQKQAGMGKGMKATAGNMKEFYGIVPDNYDSCVGYFPMMINADTVFVGKVKSGKMAAAKKELEARKQATIQNFENYLPGPLEMSKNGKVVSNGRYVMLIISGDNDKAVELFNSFVKGK